MIFYLSQRAISCILHYRVCEMCFCAGRRSTQLKVPGKGSSLIPQKPLSLKCLKRHPHQWFFTSVTLLHHSVTLCIMQVWHTLWQSRSLARSYWEDFCMKSYSVVKMLLFYYVGKSYSCIFSLCQLRHGYGTGEWVINIHNLFSMNNKLSFQFDCTGLSSWHSGSPEDSGMLNHVFVLLNFKGDLTWRVAPRGTLPGWG